MHELSICERLVGLMERELARIDPPPARVTRARLVVGEMHQIVGSLLRDAYTSLTRDGLAAGSTLEIAHAPIVGECEGCGWRGELRIPRFSCGACGSFELEIVGGKELYLDSIEIIEAEASA